MQLKFKQTPSLGQSIFKRAAKAVIFLVIIFFIFFLVEKINFPSPQKEFKIDVTNDAIKLK